VWFRRFTKYDVIPHPTEQDTLSIAFLISKQAVPYQTCGGTCCPGGSTPKFHSLADSSPTCYDGINHLHFSNHCSNHNIDPHTVTSHLDGWKTTKLSQRHKPNQHHKGWKTCTTLMTTWLSITKQEWTNIPKVWGLGNNIKSCRPICELEREREHIGLICSRVTWIAVPLAAQSPRRTLVGSQSHRRLTITIENK
jgi:hypothetical protein